jgi:hypothetical protein
MSTLRQGGAQTPPARPDANASPPGDGLSVDTVASRLFERLDANDDQSVTGREFLRLFRPLGLSPEEARAPRGLFDRFDSSNDGSLSLNEIRAAVDLADRNDDGRLTLGEAAHNPITLVGLGLLHHDPGAAAG